MWSKVPDNPYLLLTPGPLSTSKKVRAAMLRDWCTWDDDYNIDVVEDIRRRLVRYATSSPDDYTAVLMQGSGSLGGMSGNSGAREREAASYRQWSLRHEDGQIYGDHGTFLPTAQL